jgi:hypothetical protein
MSKTKKELMPLHERIQRYIDACPPAISGQSGHDQTFRVACILVQGFDCRQKTPPPSWLVTTSAANRRGARES